MSVDINALLQEFHFPFGVEDARAFLHQVRSVMDILVAYQHFFPTEYAQSMQLICDGQVSLFPAPGEPYSSHEVTFLKLVDKHFFPLPLYFVLDGASEESRCYTIPIDPFGIDPADGYGVEELPLGWQLMYYVTDELQKGFHFEGASDEELGDIFAQVVHKGRVDWDALEEVCAREHEPLAFFRYVIEMLTYNTGTAWLDSTVEMPCEDALWSIEIMDELVKQYTIATEIKEKTEQFMNWLVNDIGPHFKEVVTLWNKCVVIPTNQKAQE